MPCLCPLGRYTCPVLLNGLQQIALVWQYGEKSGFESWKGLSWGMVNCLLVLEMEFSFSLSLYHCFEKFLPLLGGAFCACTWHFFYNSESLEYESRNKMFQMILVALQAALTVIGNATMCFAAFRICKLSDKRSQKL
ncbi:hypothetical protein DITRI_Ditri07aG0144200 [Diplodiscus trichospermus]